MGKTDPYEKCVRCAHRKSSHVSFKRGACNHKSWGKELRESIPCDCPKFIPKDESWRLESDATSVTKKWQ